MQHRDPSMYFHIGAGTGSYTASTTNMYHQHVPPTCTTNKYHQHVPHKMYHQHVPPTCTLHTECYVPVQKPHGFGHGVEIRRDDFFVQARVSGDRVFAVGGTGVKHDEMMQVQCGHGFLRIGQPQRQKLFGHCFRVRVPGTTQCLPPPPRDETMAEFIQHTQKRKQK